MVSALAEIAMAASAIASNAFMVVLLWFGFDGISV
jgi:hypothetical protein